MTHPGKEALEGIAAGLEGVSGGPWHHGCFADEASSCQCKSILNEAYMGGLATIHADNGLPLSEGGNDAPPAEEAKANMRHIANCDPESIRSILAYVKSLERTIDSFEADKDFHDAQAERIRRYEDEVRDLKALAYCATDKGPVPWKEISDDAFWQMEQLRRGEMRKLQRRIHQQRERLRWWEDLFNTHVHAHWRKAHLFYFQIVRRDRDAMFKKGLEAGRASALKEIAE